MKKSFLLGEHLTRPTNAPAINIKENFKKDMVPKYNFSLL